MSDPNDQTIAGRVKTVATQRFTAIPPEKPGDKIKRTASGLVVIGLAVAVNQFAPAAPWYVPVGLAVVGANVISGELVSASFKTLADIAVKIIRAVLGKNGGAA